MELFVTAIAQSKLLMDGLKLCRGLRASPSFHTVHGDESNLLTATKWDRIMLPLRLLKLGVYK